MKVKSNQANDMAPLEIILYGAVGDYRGISSVGAFYNRLGLLARLESGEIPTVSWLHMNPVDSEALEQIILKELRRKNRGRLVSAVRTGAMMDWLNLAPGRDETVPQGELWVVDR
ncbi:hypothetical protein [Oscillibacter sp.]|uniref:hypothetical protein n=1 Tax=Oscillibacter sp. TaxID=1945593 RepID=UPI0028A1F860|nr:hypothetical protein [Oscillibacter sp.]